MIKSVLKKVFLRVALFLGALIGFGVVVGLANEIVFPINILFIAAVIIIFAVLGLRYFFKSRKEGNRQEIVHCFTLSSSDEI